MTASKSPPSPGKTTARRPTSRACDASGVHGEDDSGLSLPTSPPEPVRHYYNGELRAVLAEMFPAASDAERVRRLAAISGYSWGGARKLWYAERGVSMAVTLLVHAARRRMAYNAHKNERRTR